MTPQPQVAPGLPRDFRDAAGNVTKSYGYKPGSTWTTDPLFIKQGADYYFYQNDHLGTPQKLTAVNGAVVWTAKYSSFGEAEVNPSSTVTNNLRFPGQLYDEETGLHYNGHRYYDPKIGRYLTEDPIRFTGGINFYLYCLNHPISIVDPYGLLSTKCWVKLGLGIYHYLEGTLYSVGGAMLPALAFTAVGPAGILMAPAGFAFMWVGIIEFELGVHHIKEVISGECDKKPIEDPCDSDPSKININGFKKIM